MGSRESSPTRRAEKASGKWARRAPPPAEEDSRSRYSEREWRTGRGSCTLVRNCAMAAE